MQRKTKFAILEAKRNEANRNFKFRNSDVFINEHLSPTNRGIFAKASQKKRELGYKYLWTKNGTTHMRKTDHSEILTFKSESEIEDLLA